MLELLDDDLRGSFLAVVSHREGKGVPRDPLQPVAESLVVILQDFHVGDVLKLSGDVFLFGEAIVLPALLLVL